MAQGLFHRIREKTLAAEKRGDKRAESQYLFEDACAKTLSKLTGILTSLAIGVTHVESAAGLLTTDYTDFADGRKQFLSV